MAFASGTVISATVGVGSLVLTGYADPSKFGDVWLTWWLGDVGGQLVVAPIIVLWANAKRVQSPKLGELLKFSWVERGGPMLEPPTEQGFGMQLITELLGTAPSILFESSGLEFAVEVPVSEAVEGNN